MAVKSCFIAIYWVIMFEEKQSCCCLVERNGVLLEREGLLTRRGRRAAAPGVGREAPAESGVTEFHSTLQLSGGIGRAETAEGAGKPGITTGEDGMR